MRRRSIWAGISLTIVTCLVFGRVCVFEFTNWDDNVNITRNPLLNPPSLEHIGQFWARPFEHLYIPVTYSVWSAVAAAARVEDVDHTGIQLNPYLFHGLNLLLHLACVLAVWRLIRKFIHSEWTTALGAAVFALYPVQVEAVAWVTGTKDLLGTLLSVMAISAFIEFSRREDGDAPLASVAPRTSRNATAHSRSGRTEGPPYASENVDQRSDRHDWIHRLLWFAWSTVLFALAILSKPTAVVTPIIVLLLAAWNPWRWRRRQWVAWGSWMVIAAAGAAVTRFSQTIDLQSPQHEPIWFRPFAALDTLAFYGWKLIWPFDLAFDYGRTPARLMAGGQWHWTWIAPAGLVVLMGVSCAGRRGWICLGIFIACVLPVLGLTAFRFQQYYATAADRYLYPAMLGTALALAWMLSRVDLRRLKGRMILAATVLLLCFFSAIAFHQTGFWRDSLALCEHELAVNPRSAAGHNNRGELRYRDQQYEAALEDFRSAIEIEPRTLIYRINAAKTLMSQGRIDEGVAEWDSSLRREERLAREEGDPPTTIAKNMAIDYCSLARWIEASGRREQAIDFLKRAAEFDSTNADIRAEIGKLGARSK